jgi:hypothetical protein
MVQGRREGIQAPDTVTLTITCDADAVYVDTSADSPILASQDFTTAITDFRRGFFSLFKPLAAEVQQEKRHEPQRRDP